LSECRLAPASIVGHSAGVQSSMSPQMGPRPLLGLGSQLSGLLAPASLALTRAPVPPVVATLSVLAARPEFWAIHALSIDYAAGVTGDLEAGITRVLTDRRLGDLAESSDFQTYLGRTDLSYGEIGADPGALAYAGQILDITIVPDRLTDARMTTIKATWCMEQCGRDIVCFRDCMDR